VSTFRFSFLFEHDLFGKPVSTFPDHAVVLSTGIFMPFDNRDAARAGAIYSRKHSVERRQGDSTRDQGYAATRPVFGRSQRMYIEWIVRLADLL
jgi:hypothetical protein